MSPYHVWPLRVVHLFSGEFFGLQRYIENTQPTWIEVIIQIGENVGILNQSYNSFLRLHEFSSQIEPTDTVKDVITKLYTIAYSIPPSMMAQTSLVNSIKAQLHRYVPAVYDRMLSQYEHQASTPGVWLESLMNLPDKGFDLGHKQQPRPLGIVHIPRTTIEPSNLPLEPATAMALAQTVNPVRSSDKCLNCGKLGHWARQCRSSSTFRQDKQRTSRNHFSLPPKSSKCRQTPPSRHSK